jgi:hypothetical protein
MRPTPEQIAVAAYHRWQRRDGLHGGDHDDWVAAEKDLVFGLNYRYIARHRLDGPSVLLGRPEARPGASVRRRCRFCEQAEPAASFAEPPPPALPALLGNTALRAWDDCEDCQRRSEADLAGPFEAFARPLLGPSPSALAGPGVPVAALKALVRMALSVLPGDELHHFGDTIEWVANPDHARDSAVLTGLGCRVYLTPAPVPSPSVALARRVNDDAPWPYLLFFLATSRVVFQTHLPLCPRDEDLDDPCPLGPELSMSLGDGAGHLASPCTFLPAVFPRRLPPRAAPRPARNGVV